MASRFSLILFLLIFLIGCRPATPPPTSVDQTQTSPANGSTSSPATPVSDQIEEIRNAQYQLGASRLITDGAID